MTDELSTLDELYKINPLFWTQENLRAIIAGERKRRELWSSEQELANGQHRAPKRVTAKSVNVAAIDIDSLLNDLNL